MPLPVLTLAEIGPSARVETLGTDLCGFGAFASPEFPGITPALTLLQARSELAKSAGEPGLPSGKGEDPKPDAVLFVQYLPWNDGKRNGIMAIGRPIRLNR